MGMLNFLKKSKNKTRKVSPPDLSSLPPLPDVPEQAPLPPEPPVEETQIPKAPIQKSKSSENYEIPLFPEIPKNPEEPPKQYNNHFQEQQAMKEYEEDFSIDESIPPKIPPLKDIPEPPEFRPDIGVAPLTERKISEPIGSAIIETEAPPTMPNLDEIPPPIKSETHTSEDKAIISKKIKGVIYVKLDNYTNLLDDIEILRNDLKENGNIYTSLEDYRTSQDTKFEKYQETLEDIQRKLLFIDKLIFEDIKG